MGSELTKAGYSNMNAHQTIYVVTPEHTTGSQLIFRENTAPMIQDKHVPVSYTHLSPPAYNTAESLYVPAPSRRGPPHLQFLLSVVLVVRFVVFCWVRLVVFWVERLVVLFV